MQHLSTAFLIISLVIVVHQGSGVTAQDDDDEPLAIETRNRAITIIHDPKYVTQPKPSNQTLTKPDLPTHKPEQRPPSKPPNIPDQPAPQNHASAPRPHYGQIPPLPPQRIYPKQPLKLQYSPNSLYNFPRVIPLPPHHRTYYIKKNSRPILYSASTGSPLTAKSPKFSLPPQVINGIRTDFVKPPKILSTTSLPAISRLPNLRSTTTTTAATTITTTQRLLRTKRIWPKRILDKVNSTLQNTTLTKDNTTKTNNTDETDRDASESYHRVRYTYRNSTTGTTTVPSPTTRVYRPVTRKVKVKYTTPLPPINFTHIEPNDWVPILPSHYAKVKRTPAAPTISRRSDTFAVDPTGPNKEPLYLQTFGLVPVRAPRVTEPPPPPPSQPAVDRKNIIVVKRKPNLKPSSSGYSGQRGRAPMHTHYTHYGDLETEGSHHHSSHPRSVKIKHHHHHHHHRYIKTVEKPVKVPYKVEVPKPYPVQVEKKVPVPVEKVKIVEKPVPYPVTVEKKVPYPIGIKIPHPVPVKVVEKEYVPKPYPVVQQVPVYKQVEVKVPQPVPVHVEKKVPYPVEVKVPVPVDRPVPVPVPVEKRVPYPVPVRVLVPQPYPVEKKVPYPVQVKVKEPVEVIKHVPIKVPYPQPYAVKVPHPVPYRVEKRVPYPVEVEKKVPVPYEVIVPQKVEVEKRVPVYIPKPYPVEKRVPVPYPVKVPYPVRVPYRVPVKVPVEVPVYVNRPVHMQLYTEEQFSPSSPAPSYEYDYFGTSTSPTVSNHGSTGYTGFQSRSDNTETTTTTISPTTTPSS